LLLGVALCSPHINLDPHRSELGFYRLLLVLIWLWRRWLHWQLWFWKAYIYVLLAGLRWWFTVLLTCPNGGFFLKLTQLSLQLCPRNCSLLSIQ
jgi:hypothetical protein